MQIQSILGLSVGGWGGGEGMQIQSILNTSMIKKIIWGVGGGAEFSRHITSECAKRSFLCGQNTVNT